jgi:hypothetical protein
LLNLKQITRYGLLILLCFSAIAILHVNEVKAASPQTLEIIDTIEHDKVPLSVAVNEVTNMVYVGVNGGIIVINGTTKQTLTILPFLTVQNQSGYPNWIVVDTKTNRIFAGGDFDYIHVFDGNTNTLISNWNNNVNLYADNSQIAFDFERDLIYVASPTTWVYTYDTITVYNATTLQYSKSINIPGSYGLSSLQAINVAIDTRLNKIYAAWTRNATLFSFDGFNYTNVLKTKEGAFSSLPDIFFNPLTNILYSTTSGTTAFNGSSLGLLSLPNIGTIKALDPNLPIIYALKNNSTNTGQNLNLADGFTHNILASVDLSGLGNKVALSSRTGEIYITQQSLNRTLVILDTTFLRGSITINGGVTYANSTDVTLTLTYSDAGSGISQVRYSNDGVWDAEVWESASASKAWALTSGDGNKTVYYQVKDNAGLLSLTYSDTITLNTATSAQSSNGGTTTATVDSIKPTANAGSDLTVNEDTSMALDGSGSRDNVGIASYTWTFKDGTDKTLTGKKPSYTFNTPGVYNITLSVKDAAGNTATDLVTVTVLDVTQPVAEGGQDQNIQMGKAVRFDAGTSIDNVGVTTYEWDFGDGVKATDSNVTHTYANAGTYTVTLTTKDLAGNIAIDTVEVAVSGSEGFPIWIIGVAISFFVVGIVGAMYLFRNRRLKLISK